MLIDFSPIKINFYNSQGKRTSTTINYSVVAFWAIAHGYGKDIPTIAKNNDRIIQDLQKLINEHKTEWIYKFLIEFNILTLAQNKITDDLTAQFNLDSKQPNLL